MGVAITELLKSAKKITNINKITITQTPQKKFELYNKIKTLLEQQKNIKEILQEINKDCPENDKFIQKFVPKLMKDGLKHYLPRTQETNFLQEIKEYIEKEYNYECELKDEEQAQKRAYPGKPAITLE